VTSFAEMEMTPFPRFRGAAEANLICGEACCRRRRKALAKPMALLAEDYRLGLDCREKVGRVPLSGRRTTRNRGLHPPSCRPPCCRGGHDGVTIEIGRSSSSSEAK